jgi:nucleoside-diphosphate-sugar epimerase
MKILLTGSNGYIGKHLKNKLSQNNLIFEISRDKKYCKNTNNCFYFDLSTNKKISKITSTKLKDTGINCIIHMAFETNKNKKSNNFQLLQKNMNISFAMAEIIKIIKPSIFLNFSSVSVYPYKNGCFDELSICDPSFNSDFFYGLAKINSELMFNHILDNYGIRIVHLRLSQVIDKEMPNNRIYPIFLEQILKNNKIEIYGNGLRKIPIINISYLNTCIDKIINSNFEGIINIGQENISIKNLARRAIKLLGDKNTKIIYNKEKTISNNKFTVDFKLIKSLFN